MQTCGGFSRRSRSALARSLFILALLFAQYGALRMPQAVDAGGPSMGVENVEMVGQIGGSSHAFAVAGTYGYVGVGASLYVLDVSDPVDPIPVGHLMLPDIVKGIDVQGAYAYVADRWEGLCVVDVSDPTNPRQVGNWPNGWVHGVAVDGPYAYTAGVGGMEILDITNPAAPVLRGNIDTIGYGQRVAVQGAYAYYADGSAGLRIIDVSAPSAPIEVGRVASMRAEGVAVAGDFAYVATDKAGGMLTIVHVADPAAPHVEGSCDVPGTRASAVEVAGSHAYVSAIGNTQAEWGLRVVDVSVPGSPVAVGFYPYPGYNTAFDVAVSGDYAYVTTDGSGGIRVVGVASPASPVLVSEWLTLGRTWDTAAIGHYIYTRRESTWGEVVIDIVNPDHPVEVGSLPWGIDDLILDGSVAYAASAGLRVLDVRDPVAPVQLAYLSSPWSIACLAKSGDHVYMAEQGYWDGVKYTGGGLWIADVSNPLSPRVVGHTPIDGWVRSVAVVRDHVYLAYQQQGLTIIDVSNPAAPVHVGQIPDSQYHQVVGSDGQYVYWAVGWPDGLRVLDVTDPAHPVVISTVDTMGVGEKVIAVGGYLLVDNSRGLFVLDISDPVNPVEVGRCETAGDTTSGMAYADGLVVINSLDGGIYVLRPLKEEVSVQIWPAGGSLTSPSGDVTVTLPPGVFTEQVLLEYQRPLLEQPATGSLVSGGLLFDLRATYVSSGDPAQPVSPFTMTVTYDPTELGPTIEATLAIYWWNGTRWLKEPTSGWDGSAHTVTATLEHLSRFAVLGETNRVYLPLVLR